MKRTSRPAIRAGAAVLLAAVGMLAGAQASAQGQLNVICPVQAEWCNIAAVE